MKQILNWRWWVLSALLGVGFLMVALMFGEDNLPLIEFIEVRIYLAIAASACFYTLGRLTKRWQNKGKVEV